MVKLSDEILNIIRKAAVSTDAYFNLPAYTALLTSIDFWGKYDKYKNENKLSCFFYIMLAPKYFYQTDLKIADDLYLSEKSVRNYRKEFKERFVADYEKFQALDEDSLLTIQKSCFAILGKSLSEKQTLSSYVSQ